MMNSDNDFPVFPVTGWQVGPKSDQNVLVFKIGYCTSSWNPNATTFDSPFFSMTPSMAKSLIYDLQRYVAHCEENEFQQIAI